jgi:hypothetical protein
MMGKSGSIFLMNLLFAVTVSHAQHFSVQIAAYSEQQLPAFFEERGVTNYSERRDISGVYWYSAGEYATREEAEVVQQEVKSKGFPYASVIDLDEQRLLSGVDCPVIRDGVVFIQAPQTDTSRHVIYFDFGSSGLTTSSR